MLKSTWMFWFLPAAVWAVYMCWLTGYQAGYSEGHEQAWVNARGALSPMMAQADHSLIAMEDRFLVD